MPVIPGLNRDENRCARECKLGEVRESDRHEIEVFLSQRDTHHLEGAG